jgi:hypothetical protein
MKLSYSILSFFIVLLSALEAARPEVFSLSVGAQSIGVRYQFSEESALVESAKGIAALGSDTLKIALTPKYVKDYKMSRNRKIQSLVDLVNLKPDYLKVMDMPFRNIMLWVYPFSDSRSAFSEGAVDKRERSKIYREIYDFTALLLKRYSGSGKSFFLGNWEGDWHVLLENYDYDLNPNPNGISGAIDWFLLREKAIADAIENTPHHDVSVYFYVELNHVAKSMDAGKPTIVNSVLPFIKTDFVSWSSYDVTKQAVQLSEAEGKQRVWNALDYIEAHLPESDIQGKRVFIGEYGYPLVEFENPIQQSEYSASLIKWALEWGCPFILYWELYCNEFDEQKKAHRGYWLIDDKNEKQPVWFLHKAILDKGNAFVDSYQKENGILPTQKFYNEQIVSWMNGDEG